MEDNRSWKYLLNIGSDVMYFGVVFISNNGILLSNKYLYVYVVKLWLIFVL